MMKKHVMRAIYYIGISFTTVSALLVVTEFIGILPYGLRPAPLQLLIVCVLLSAVQVVFDIIPAIENRRFLRILINLNLLFIVGGRMFGWFVWNNNDYGFGQGLLSLAVGVIASILAYTAGSLYINYRMRKDAEEINRALKKRSHKSLEETKNEKDN
ncbi:hypothetical protein IAI10_15205 [Clostridium sp. 19966]|uniref:hypothetical protein n=1 Tax=Clostridium sp. 19966 TaxID=2768166 RepID=UPI0028DF96CD|nr:hypothetical protein [Clostridium sp. 19966]MDT8718012.1 hypothetical protein [Clostridium sp. 19966]